MSDDDANTWLLRRDPYDVNFRKTHLCPLPQRNGHGKIPGASIGDIWRCECGTVWKITVAPSYRDHIWRRVRGLRGLWLRRRQRTVISETLQIQSKTDHDYPSKTVVAKRPFLFADYSLVEEDDD